MGHSTRACLAFLGAAIMLSAGAAGAAQKPSSAKAPAAKARAKSPTEAKTKVPTGPIAPSAVFYVIRRTEEAWTVMDPAAVERTVGSPVARAYSVTVRRNLLNGGPPQPGYVRTLVEYDCGAHATRWRAFTIYNRFGAVVVKQDNTDTAFHPLERGSEEETTFRVICEAGGGGSVVAAPSLAQLVIGLMQAWDDAGMAGSLQALKPIGAEGKAIAKPGAKPAPKLSGKRVEQPAKPAASSPL
jgi:hypothetical protein